MNKKRLVVILICFSLLLSLNFTSANLFSGFFAKITGNVIEGENLLENGGFENSKIGEGIPTGWGKSSSNDEGVLYFVKSGGDGKVMDINIINPKSSYVGIKSDAISVKPNTQYKLTGFISSNINSEDFVFTLNVFPKENAKNNFYYKVDDSSITKFNSIYDKTEIVFTTSNEENLYAYVIATFIPGKTGSVSFDNIKLVELKNEVDTDKKVDEEDKNEISEEVVCVDSDGLDPYNKGKVEIEENIFYDTCKISTDNVCNSYGCEGLLVNNCSGEDCFVDEYICVGDGLRHFPYNCPNGCKDGACIMYRENKDLSSCEELFSGNITEKLPKKIGDYELVECKYYGDGRGECAYSYSDSKKRRVLIIAGLSYYDKDYAEAISYLSHMKKSVPYEINSFLTPSHNLGKYYSFTYSDTYRFIYWIDTDKTLIYIVEFDEDFFGGDIKFDSLFNQEDNIEKFLKDNSPEEISKSFFVSDELNELFEDGSFDFLISKCPSNIDDSCSPDWVYSVEPRVCPEHGYVMEIFEDKNHCPGTRVIEKRKYCTPGICSGCVVPAFMHITGLQSSNSKCIPYGFRFSLVAGYSEEEIDGSEIRVYGNESDIEIMSNFRVIFFEGGKEYTLRLNEETRIYDLGEGGYTGSFYYSVTPVKIYYSENPDESYVDIETRLYLLEGVEDTTRRNEPYYSDIVKSFNGYCDIDGEIKMQKTKTSDGSWAKCQNNYECESNICTNGKCFDLESEIGFFKKLGCRILSWLGGDYNKCISGETEQTIIKKSPEIIRIYWEDEFGNEIVSINSSEENPSRVFLVIESEEDLSDYKIDYKFDRRNSDYGLVSGEIHDEGKVIKIPWIAGKSVGGIYHHVVFRYGIYDVKISFDGGDTWIISDEELEVIEA